jgi:hypothetical protein
VDGDRYRVRWRSTIVLSGLRLEKQIVLACPEAQQLPSFGP